jgi:hypothetical protein
MRHGGSDHDRDDRSNSFNHKNARFRRLGVD